MASLLSLCPCVSIRVQELGGKSSFGGRSGGNGHPQRSCGGRAAPPGCGSPVRASGWPHLSFETLPVEQDVKPHATAGTSDRPVGARAVLLLPRPPLSYSVAMKNRSKRSPSANVYISRFDEAESLYRRALAIAERIGERRLIASVCHNLGGIAHARGDHAAGIRWARRSVQVRNRSTTRSDSPPTGGRSPAYSLTPGSSSRRGNCSAPPAWSS